MFKINICFFVFQFSTYYSEATDSLSKYAVGLRTGAVHNTLGFKFKHKNINLIQLREPNTNFYNQLYIQRYFGKNNRMLIELNFGLYINADEAQLYTPAYFEYNYIKHTYYNPNLAFRYNFLEFKNLYWTHWVGIIISPEFINRYKIQYDNHISTNGQPQKYESKSKNIKTYHGIEYFSKIQINKKLSVQFGTSAFFYYPGYEIIGAKYATKTNIYTWDYRFNTSFGLGWHF